MKLDSLHQKMVGCKNEYEENLSKTLLFKLFKVSEKPLFIVFNFVLGNKLICILQCLLGRLFTKNGFFQIIFLELCSAEI